MNYTFIYDEQVSECSAEMVLLINVLDRAMRDLTEPDPVVNREAFAWFSKWQNTMHLGYVSYKDVLDVIDIGAERLGKIEGLLNDYRTKKISRVPFKHTRTNFFRRETRVPHARIALVK